MIKYYVTSLLIILSLSFAKAQGQFCGTKIQDSSIKFQSSQSQLKTNNTSNRISNLEKDILYVPLIFHIIGSENDQRPLSMDEVLRKVNQLNTYVKDAKLYFYIDKRSENVIEEKFYDFEYSTENLNKLSASLNTDQRSIHIFLTNTLFWVGKNEQKRFIGGHAHFPFGKSPFRNYVVIPNNIFMEGTVLAHELGHTFGLYHTHETNFSQELVERTNCLKSGDFLCDTPADPSLGTSQNNVDHETCKYNGTKKDDQGHTYSPAVNNIMSYAPLWCTSSFSPEQLLKMRSVTEDYKRGQVLSRAVFAPKEFSFFFLDDEKRNSARVKFDIIGNPGIKELGTRESVLWSFGDSTRSVVSNPIHHYKLPGNYLVKLKVGDMEFNKHLSVGHTGSSKTIDFEDIRLIENDIRLGENAVIYVGDSLGKNGTSGLVLTAKWYSQISFKDISNAEESGVASGININYHAQIDFPIDAKVLSDLKLSFDFAQIAKHSGKYSSFGVYINNTTPVGTWNYYHGIFDTHDTIWARAEIDLKDYDLKEFDLTFRGVHHTPLYEDHSLGIHEYRGNATIIDNIVISGKETAPLASMALSDSAICIQYDTLSVVSTSSGSISKYEWDFGDQAIPETANGPGPHHIVYQKYDESTITLKTTSPLGSSMVSTSPSAATDCIVLSSSEAKPDNLLIYPNPFTSKINIKKKDNSTYEVNAYNTWGQALIKEKIFLGKEITLDLEGLKPGYYVIELIQTRSKKILRRKVFKN